MLNSPKRPTFTRPPARLLFGCMVAAALAMPGCSDDDNDVGNNECNTESIPLSDDVAGPVLTEVIIECQGTNMNVLATVTDPQGDADLLQVVQRIVVYGRNDCEGDLSFEVSDDLAGSGLEESFGIVLARAANESLFDEICAETEWPVEVDLHDASGHHTAGKVMARVRN